MKEIKKLDISTVKNRDISDIYKKINEIIDVVNHKSFKPIIVVYLGLKELNHISEKREATRRIKEYFSNEDFHTVIIPHNDNNSIDIQCIYPKEIDEDLEEQIQEIERKLNEFLEI